MEFYTGAPMAMLLFLLAPLLAQRWATLAIFAAIGLLLPAAVIYASGGLDALNFKETTDPSTQILVVYCALFLGFFTIPLAARLLGLALQTRGWPRWRLLPLDLFALAPAAGFYGTLFLTALPS